MKKHWQYVSLAALAVATGGCLSTHISPSGQADAATTNPPLQEMAKLKEPELALDQLPELGVQLPNLPDSHVKTLVNSSDFGESYGLTIGGVDYKIAVSHDGEVVMISTKSPPFKTPEGFSVTNTIGDLLAIYPKGKRKEPGWGSYILLPSGWGAYEALDGSFKRDSKVRYYFKRKRDGQMDLSP